MLYNTIMAYLEDTYKPDERTDSQLNDEALDIVDEITTVFGGDFYRWQKYQQELDKRLESF